MSEKVAAHTAERWRGQRARREKVVSSDAFLRISDETNEQCVSSTTTINYDDFEILAMQKRDAQAEDFPAGLLQSK